MGPADQPDEEFLDVVIINGEPMRVMMAPDARRRIEQMCADEGVPFDAVVRQAISNLVENGGAA